MKHAQFHNKLPGQDTSFSQHRPVAGPNGIAIAPPKHGIDFVDQQRSIHEQMPIQRRANEATHLPDRRQDNRTGLPDHLKAGIENLSGFDMSDVRVHYNSSQPAQLNALAYTQGTDIHIAPRQEKYLPHEAWHVVQQARGQVKPTRQMKQSVLINDDRGLEHEADVMGAKAATMDRYTANHISPAQRNDAVGLRQLHEKSVPPAQRAGGIEYETNIPVRIAEAYNSKVKNSGWVEQDRVIARWNRWEIQSDNSKLEFVTDTLSITDLETTMNTMLDELDFAQGMILTKDNAERLYLNELFPESHVERGKYLVTERGTISGAPQGTLGIPFKKLYKFFDFLTKYELASSKIAIKVHQDRAESIRTHSSLSTEVKEEFERNLKEENLAGTKSLTQSTASQFTEISKAVNKQLPEQSDEETQKVKGLIHFIAQYALASTYAETGYKKKRFSIMARSSFHSMYNGLTDDGKRVFKEKVNLVLRDLKFTGKEKLFPESKESFTLWNWVQSIVKAVSRNIPTKDDVGYKSFDSDLMTSPGVWSDGTPTDKSMGAFEELDRDDQSSELVVVELRALHHFSRTKFGSFPISAMRSMVKDLTNILNQTSETT